MRYVPKQGDTFFTVARDLTLSGDYAEALATSNGVFEDVSNVGEPIPYERHKSIAWLGSIEIPDNWLKPGGAAQGNGLGSSAKAFIVIIAIMGVVTALVGKG